MWEANDCKCSCFQYMIKGLVSENILDWNSYVKTFLKLQYYMYLSCDLICNFLKLAVWISISVKFPYLVQKKLKEGQEVRRVAQLDWQIIEDHYEKPFVASGLRFTPLPVSFTYLIGTSCSSYLFLHLTCIFLYVGYAWRRLYMFGVSFWWKI